LEVNTVKLTWKDGLATLLVAALAVTYGFYLALGSIGPPWVGIQDATGMAVVGLGVGVIITVLSLGVERTAGRLRDMVVGLRLVSVILGLLALFGENLFSAAVWEGVLAAFMASIVLIWGIALSLNAGLLGGGSTNATRGRRPA